MKPKETYNRFFRLERNPFGETPDPEFFHASLTHENALGALNSCVLQGRGFALMTGEVGMGKTLTSRIFLTALEGACNTALILYPRLSETELLQTICEEFEIAGVGGAKRTTKGYLDLLNAFLLEGAAAGRSSILVIDEAQSMPAETLEAIRLLSNLETRTEKLLQIVMIAQPEIRETLARPELRQLRQRISVDVNLEPMSAREVERYVKSRLETAGGGNFVRFDAGAIALVHRLSGGIPRRINQICEALIEGASKSRIRLIDARFARRELGLGGSVFSRILSGITRSAG
jgi:general secretion pathway protein A